MPHQPGVVLQYRTPQPQPAKAVVRRKSAVRREEKVTVTVRAVNAKLRFGAAKKVTLRAKR